MSASSSEFAPSPRPPTPEQLAADFVARLPEVESHIGTLLGSDLAHGSGLPDGQPFRRVQAYGAHEGMGGLLCVSNLPAKSDAGLYAMRMEGVGPSITWRSGTTNPGAVIFRTQPYQPRRFLRPNFTLAHQLADLLPNAEPVEVEPFGSADVRRALGCLLSKF